MKKVEFSEAVFQVKQKPVFIHKDKIKFVEEVKEPVSQQQHMLSESMISMLSELSLTERQDKGFGEMTMISESEFVDIELPTEVIVDIEKTVGNIKDCLSTNKEFCRVLIENCLKLNKENFYWDDIRDLLFKEYPNLLDYKDGNKLLVNTRILTEIMFFEHKSFRDYPKQTLNNFRDKVEQIIQSIKI